MNGTRLLTFNVASEAWRNARLAFFKKEMSSKRSG